MNSMTQAFTQAVAKTAAANGVPVKMPTRMNVVWLWLKDHPNRTSPEVAKAVHIQEQQVYALIWQMLQRKMLARQRGSRMGKGVWEYTAVGKEYELLPMPPKPKAAAEPKAATEPPVATLDLSADEAAALDKMLDIPPAPPKFDIEVYTLGELRAIHAQLKALFG